MKIIQKCNVFSLFEYDWFSYEGNVCESKIHFVVYLLQNPPLPSVRLLLLENITLQYRTYTVQKNQKNLQSKRLDDVNSNPFPISIDNIKRTRRHEFNTASWNHTFLLGHTRITRIFRRIWDFFVRVIFWGFFFMWPYGKQRKSLDFQKWTNNMCMYSFSVEKLVFNPTSSVGGQYRLRLPLK